MARKNGKHKDQDAQQAAEASRNGSAADASPAPDAATAAESASGGGGLGRLLLLVILAGLLAVVLSKDLRAKVLDLMFGAEEEFDYSSTTMPATDAPSSVGAPAS